MTDQPGLESLYQEARSALNARDYIRAGGLLRQILQIDENYKDASRLLAQMVKLRRRRWYNHPVLWTVLGVVVIVWLGIWLAPKIPLTAAVDSTASISPTLTITPAPPVTPAFTPTQIPLSWKRISMVSEFGGDQTRILVIDPRDAETVYLGSEVAGLYKSINGGISFQPIQQGLKNSSIYTLAIDPVDTQILFAGFLPGVLYRTKDGGNSWEHIQVHGRAEIGCGGSVVIDPNNHKHVLWAAGCNPVYESINGGDTWTVLQQSHCPTVISVLAFDPQDSQRLYAGQLDSFGDGCPAGIYVSNDNGKKFEFANASLRVDAPNAPNRLAVGIGANRDFVIASGNFPEVIEPVVFVSRDGGVTWELSRKYCEVFKSRPDGSVLARCFNGTFNAFQVTNDGGISWNEISNPPLQLTNIIAISLNDANLIYLGGSGVIVSKDGGISWEELRNGLPTGRLTLSINPYDHNHFYLDGGLGPLFSSEDSGANWRLFTEEGLGLAFDADGTSIYRVGEDALLFRENGQEHWNRIDIPGKRIRGVASHPTTPGVLYLVAWNGESGYDASIYRIENGILGKEIGMPRPNNVYADPAYHFAPSNPDRMYLSSSNALPIYSNDGGASWSKCGDSRAYSGFSVSNTRFAVHPSDSNTVFLGSTGYGILKSNDGCHSWKFSNSGLDSLSVNTIAIDPNNPDIVYIGTDSGAFISFNGGETWGQVNDGLLGATVVYSIVVDKDSNVYAATPYGIFKLEGK